VERDKQKKSESVGQTLPELPWKQKRGDLKKLGFLRFHGNGSHFEKNQPLTAQLHMAYDIPTRFHKV
jgi:hypothetical protein